MASIVKVIEVIAESDQGWEQAAQSALEHASRTIRNIKSIYVEDFQAVVENNRIVNYRLNAKISFVLEEGERAG
jgi:flavin-binding protein dodecin